MRLYILVVIAALATAFFYMAGAKNFVIDSLSRVLGQGEKYIAYAQIKGKLYFMANKFNIPKAPIELVVGGKKGIYHSKRCLSISMVLEAAKHFADRGALAQTFNWETN